MLNKRRAVVAGATAVMAMAIGFLVFRPRSPYPFIPPVKPVFVQQTPYASFWVYHFKGDYEQICKEAEEFAKVTGKGARYRHAFDPGITIGEDTVRIHRGYMKYSLEKDGSIHGQGDYLPRDGVTVTLNRIHEERTFWEELKQVFGL